MDVTDVLRDRMHTPAGLQRMISASLAAHALIVAIVIVAPGGLLSHHADPPRPVMTISLGGGGDGPQNGGMTTMGGRPVQVQTPPEEIVKRVPFAPPAAKTPEMTEPLPNAKVVKASKAPAPIIKEAPDQARGRTPTKGAQPSPGSTVADTGIRGQGFGLSTGGGPGTGSTLDVQDFCCPGYIALMVERIRSAWQRDQGTPGQCLVKFTIQRDGSLTNTSVERGSGTFTLDTAAQRAVLQTRTLPPLPAEFPNSTLTVHLSFQYQ
jgi:TonB family protein